MDCGNLPIKNVFYGPLSKGAEKIKKILAEEGRKKVLLLNKFADNSETSETNEMWKIKKKCFQKRNQQFHQQNLTIKEG